MKTISFTEAAWADYIHWVNSDQKKLKKIIINRHKFKVGILFS
jgi:Txe/YoeB family toxin of Txe-Axe toxin-antitoxin module